MYAQHMTCHVLSVHGASLPRRDESFQPDRVSSEYSPLAETMSAIHLQRIGGVGRVRDLYMKWK